MTEKVDKSFCRGNYPCVLRRTFFWPGQRRNVQKICLQSFKAVPFLYREFFGHCLCVCVCVSAWVCVCALRVRTIARAYVCKHAMRKSAHIYLTLWRFVMPPVHLSTCLRLGLAETLQLFQEDLARAICVHAIPVHLSLKKKHARALSLLTTFAFSRASHREQKVQQKRKRKHHKEGWKTKKSVVECKASENVCENHQEC